MSERKLTVLDRGEQSAVDNFWATETKAIEAGGRRAYSPLEAAGDAVKTLTIELGITPVELAIQLANLTSLTPHRVTSLNQLGGTKDWNGFFTSLSQCIIRQEMLAKNPGISTEWSHRTTGSI